jgi:hypothetical protein
MYRASCALNFRIVITIGIRVRALASNGEVCMKAVGVVIYGVDKIIV